MSKRKMESPQSVVCLNNKLPCEAILCGCPDCVKVITNGDLLCKTIEKGDTETTVWLIKNGANVNSFICNGISPLHVASREGYADIVSILLEHNAHIDIHDYDRRNALFYACENGHIDVIKILLKNGSNIAKTGYGDMTPLQCAIKNRSYDVAKILLDNDALFYRRVLGANRQVLSKAIYTGYYEMVKLILEYRPDVNLWGDNLETPLHVACMMGNLDIVRLLIENGADVHKKNCLGYEPLDKACSRGFHSIARLLIEKGSNVNSNDSRILPPVLKAIYERDIEMVRILVDNGAIIDGNDKIHSPLETAIHSGFINIIEYLFEKGAKINEDEKIQCYILNNAIKKHDVDLIRLLINNGIRITPTKYLTNPIIQSILEDKIDILKLLIESGVPFPMDIIYIAVEATRCTDIIEYLIEIGGNVNVVCYGFTPLHIALQKRYIDIIKILLDNNASINIKSKGFTHLEWAMDFGDIEITKIFNVFMSPWNPKKHEFYSKRTRKIIRTIITLSQGNTQLKRLPREILYFLCEEIVENEIMQIPCLDSNSFK